MTEILNTVTGIHAIVNSLAEFFGNRTETALICDSIERMDAEFRTLYLSSYPHTYLYCLFTTLMVLGMIFVMWNGK